ncbi:toll/interleukin-1 receptor domain-containing protein [Streptomyces sp. NPDC051162]|uniref:toll/interleukin-1 receptor domain-containing protein n=1 Tax=Streptomyces sp. NPDC051162 TaxID=3154747 RepID=UPI0034381EAC
MTTYQKGHQTVHEVFINYRTATGGKETAYIFDGLLSRRFGEDSIFRATKSIPPGMDFIDALINGVRRSSVLLALIGPDWLDAPDQKQQGRRALTSKNDWVRREIEEAFACGVLVIPILLGRKVEQLDRRRLPDSLARLATCQYERYSQRSAEADIARLGDRLVKQVPRLAALDRGTTAPATADPQPDPTGNDGSGHGTIGTVVNDAHAPFHTGSGSQINGTQVNGAQINGDGTNYIAGDNRGGIRQQFPARGKGNEK